MKPENIFQEIKRIAYTNGAKLIGIADLKKIDIDDFLINKDVLQKFTCAISIAVPLLRGIFQEIIDHPTLLYFHHYRQINNLLDRIALEIAQYIENTDKNFLAMPIPASQIVDWQTQRGHLSHKRIAVQAGLGWLGRNNLLVTKEYGAQVRLTTILTNIEFPLSVFLKSIPFSCGECEKCLKGCPASAINTNPDEFDHFKCFEKLKEFQRKGYTHQYICGICVKVCGPQFSNSATGI
ncbi:MAG: hypothetical protein ABIK10_04670 [candidate division WOR-3 bacterium]